MKPFWPLVLLLSFPLVLSAQTGSVRGHVLDSQDGFPVAFCTVRLEGLEQGTTTDVEGFFNLGNIQPGVYQLIVSYLGYADATQTVEIKPASTVYRRILLEQAAIELEQVDVSAERALQRTAPLVSRIQIRREEILAAPAIGGEADLAQYLSVLPGVVRNGDQGGQLFIRGGAPVQNKILLDGMTLFNPFHSIGLFSVFETEILRSVDVHTAAFQAEYGGRVSAVMDIKTREGNTRRTSGLVSVSPFQVKGLVEGPLHKMDAQGNAVSFLFTGKQGIIDQTSPALYPYATDTSFFAFARQDTALTALQKLGLPYQYQDFYGKLSWIGSQGSKFEVFGFNFQDAFSVADLTRLSWNTSGGGTRFSVVPSYSDMRIDGSISYANYTLNLVEKSGGPRRSGVQTYAAQLHFASLKERRQFRYGFELTGFSTDFEFENPLRIVFSQQDFTTELAGYLKYTYQGKRLILEPGMRVHYYASQAKLSPEPRFSGKYNLSDAIRIKGAFGWYAQNLLGTVNDLDVVNLFVGYLAGPEETLYQPGTRTPVKNRLQLARHAVFGVEGDLTQGLSLSLEGYQKQFTQLIQVNRNKLSGSDADFVIETGDAIGVDLSLTYRGPRLYSLLSYSLGQVLRSDGVSEYPASFDRRHNLNLLGVYTFGRQKRWEAALQWNLGSGFPFTQTQGFFQDVPVGTTLTNTNVLSGNHGLGILLSSERNGGRLPYYHRLDASLKHRIQIGQNSQLEINASVRNAYNRANVFYIDRTTNQTVHQLPIIPALGLTGRF